MFPPHGALDLVGPGVNVYSSVPGPQMYRRLQGTSMATPHVAGIAALIAEARPELKAHELLNVTTQMVQRISGDKRDIGAGLIQAP
jgi:subtilisin